MLCHAILELSQKSLEEAPKPTMEVDGQMPHHVSARLEGCDH